MFRASPNPSKLLKILTIETTCDETAAAVVTDQREILGSVVASQDDLHADFAGIVPEIAARAHMERMLPVIDRTLREAGMELTDLDAIAVAHTPGLAGSLLVGLVAAKALCLATGLPLIAVNHLHAHIYACQFQSETSVYPCVGLVVSGGHTHLYAYPNPLHPEYLGGTIDDAAGEAFDKVATMLGLPYPGGPAVSRLAEQGNPEAYRFPRSFLRDDRIAFSFSGLKTAVRYAIAGSEGDEPDPARLTEAQKADLAASFQQAVVDCLVAKSLLACQQTACTTLCVGGGVAANRLFRDQLQQRASEAGVAVHLAPPELCTDNAVMGAIAVEMYRAGQFAELDLDIVPGLVREHRGTASP